MAMVDQLLTYIASVPPSAHVDEFKDQLSAYTHRDLRAACSRLGLVVPRRLNKKGGFLAVLASYWQGSPIPDASTPPKPKANTNVNALEVPSDVVQMVEVFPPEEDVEELRGLLYGYRSRTLRSACVLLELHPKKNYTKPNFVGLLASYWQDSVMFSQDMTGPGPGPDPGVRAETPRSSRVVEPNATPRTGRAESDEPLPEPAQVKRTRGDEVLERTPKLKKPKVLERSGDLFQKEGPTALAASLEKAKLVKEWASAIEILSRVDGSADSISSIRALIDGVVESAASEV